MRFGRKAGPLEGCQTPFVRGMRYTLECCGGAAIDATIRLRSEHMKKFLAVYLGSPASMNKWANLDEAESHEAAAKLFLSHPHFSIFPGDSIEIMECLPIPGQH